MNPGQENGLGGGDDAPASDVGIPVAAEAPAFAVCASPGEHTARRVGGADDCNDHSGGIVTATADATH